MKKVFFCLSILCLLFVACSDDDDNTNNPPATDFQLYGYGYIPGAGEDEEEDAMYSLDPETGKYDKLNLKMFDLEFYDFIHMPGTKTIYGIEYGEREMSEAICSYNMDTQEYKRISPKTTPNYGNLLTKDGELYNLEQNSSTSNVTLYKVDIATGAYTTIADFGVIDKDEFGCVYDPVFDAKGANIICATEEGSTLILNLAKKAVTYIESDEDECYTIFRKGDEVCMLAYTGAGMILYSVNVDAASISKVGSFNGEWTQCTYSTTKDRLYCLSDNEGNKYGALGYYDYKTGSFKKLMSESPIEWIFGVE
ncbi:hypothetical protein [Bacteroides sp. 51]|uniref:hypothetical protein n=1 Tax=Bacteroides sp. 51 TaxID=2302938 RepID=UPI0013D684DA|nr:hypothetical protein [Bacteroides sp. 51]NDV81711.1 hypothetical protein [Bacteroides sp. 51]